MRAEVAAPLIEQVTADGIDYLTGRERMWRAQAAHDRAGRLRKRAAGRVAIEADSEHRVVENAVRRRWGGLPSNAASVGRWAETVAEKRADADPRVEQTMQEAEQATREQNRLAGRHMREYASISLRSR